MRRKSPVCDAPTIPRLDGAIVFAKSLYNADDHLAACGQVLADHPSSGLLLAGSDQWSITTRTLRGGVSEGVEVIDLCNGPLTVSVLPTRGMGVWKAQYKELRLGWDSPVQRPVHPQFVDQSAALILIVAEHHFQLREHPTLLCQLPAQFGRIGRGFGFGHGINSYSQPSMARFESGLIRDRGRWERAD